MRCRTSLPPATLTFTRPIQRGRVQPVASKVDNTQGQDVIHQRLSEDEEVRTAIAVEPRDGRLCVFMPPVEDFEDYLDLLSAAEASARELGLPIHIEGYPPPHDPRMTVIRVAPDPGVIEVNIQPATNWGECVDITTGVYDDASHPSRR